MRTFGLAAVGFALIAGAFMACSDFTPPGAGTSSSGLTVNPRTAHVNVGTTAQLSAIGSSGTVVWSSSDASIASVSAGRVMGVGSGTVTIRAVSGTSSATSKITVTRAAAIALSSGTLTFSGGAASAPDSQVVDLTNSGDDPLTGLNVSGITYGTGASGWLTATLTGTTAPAKLILRPNVGSLAPGAYSATVAVSAPALASPVSITINFTIVRPASIALGASGAAFSVQTGGTLPAQQSVSVTNGGDSPLTGLAVGAITYGPGATGWLDASVAPNAAPATLLVRPNTAALTAGDYTASVPLTSTVAGVAPATLTVTYHVSSAPTPPSIVLSRGAVSFDAIIGQAVPTAATVDVTNGGQTALTGLTVTTAYGAGQPTGWLTVGGGTGTAPATITLQPSTTALTAGTYTATITVASPVANNHSVALTVTYNVIRPASIVLGASTATFSAQATTAVPAQQSIAITNGGDAPLTGLAVGTIAYSAGATGWLTASVSASAAPSSLLLQPNVTSLAIGDYTATVPVTSTVAGVAPGSVTVTYHVTAAPAPPVIVLSQTSLTFGATSGQTIPVQQTVNVTNGGQVALTGVSVSTTYAQGNGWLTVTPSGTTAPLSLTIQPNTAALAAGTYNATISVASAVASNTPRTISVTYTVIRPASVVLASTTASFTVQQSAAAPGQQQIQITNGGDAPLTGLAVGTITYSAGATGWLTASVTSTTAPSFLSIQPNATNLAAGDYTATVPVTSSVSGVASQSVTVTYHVAPVITLSSAQLSFSAVRTQATPASQVVNVTAAGAGTLNGLSVSTTYTTGNGWLTVGLGATTAPTTVTIQPNTTALTAGTYTASVVVSSSISGVAPKTIAVTYVVSEPPSITLGSTALTFSAKRTSPSSQSVAVTNGGGNTLDGLSTSITYNSGPTNGWLTASLVATTAPTSITVTVNNAGPLTPGTYTATVTVSSTVAGVASKQFTVTFTRLATMSGEIWSAIQTAGCIGCHTGVGAADGVRLEDSTFAQSSLVNHVSHRSASLIFVTPFNTSTTASYFLPILNGTAQTVANGSQSDNMPLSCLNGTNCVSTTVLQLITTWIQQGAIP